MQLEIDGNRQAIQGFAPTKGTTLSGAYTPTKTECIKFGSDVDVSINGVSISYTSGDGLVLVDGVTYTFSASVNVHMMG